MKKFVFDIDVVGACNLKCPSCPQGNINDYRLPNGYMEPELITRIISKAKSECRLAHINLASWTEPLLHPRLPEITRMVRDAGVPYHLSSNLNILRNADAIMDANPSSFRISVSGFTQKVYGYSHRGGDIGRVKKHMVDLAEAKKRNNAITRLYVCYHRYRHNLKEEPLMREFAADLGIDFEPVWARMFPLEKILGYVSEDASLFQFTGEDRQLLDCLAVPLNRALEISKKYSNQPCGLRDETISMDFQGNVQLCCGVFDVRKFAIGNYLAMPLDEIQMLRQSHSGCGLCIRHGAHVYIAYGIHELEEEAIANIAPEDSELLDLRYDFAQKRLKHRLEMIYRKYFPKIINDEQKAALGACFDRIQYLVGCARRSFLVKG